jgi:hypothetical protein
VTAVIESARRTVSRQVNSTLVLMNWHIGQLINTAVLADMRADYGKQILATLSPKLTDRYGSGFDPSNLQRMVTFAREFPQEILATVSQELSWSHIRELLPLKDPTAREFYADQAAEQHLSVRDQREAIGRKAYERREIANSRIEPGSAVPLDVFKDPMVLDFLSLTGTGGEGPGAGILRAGLPDRTAPAPP